MPYYVKCSIVNVHNRTILAIGFHPSVFFKYFCGEWDRLPNIKPISIDTCFFCAYSINLYRICVFCISVKTHPIPNH